MPDPKASSLLDTRVVYCDDNLEPIQKLPAACVDLVYIDPPFNSNRKSVRGPARIDLRLHRLHAPTLPVGLDKLRSLCSAIFVRLLLVRSPDLVRDLIAAFLLALPLCADAQDGAKPIPAKELQEFLGPVCEKAVAWTKYEGPDFEVYYGHANSPLAGEVGFYLGFAPQQPEPALGSVAIQSKLGIFPVTWHRTTDKNGSIRQRALLHLDDTQQVDIWVSAKREQDIAAILDLVSALPRFTQKPAHTP